MYDRMSKRLASLFTFFSEPAFENLLPPPPPEQYRRPLTLVLTLDDLLIHSNWDTQHGWRTGKRPGLDYFLGYLSQYYEIVVFQVTCKFTPIRPSTNWIHTMLIFPMPCLEKLVVTKMVN